MTPKRQKVPISSRALVQRINRKLKADHQQVRATRGTGRMWTTLGDFYVVDIGQHFIASHHVDIEELARDLEVMAAWEELEGTR